jgi:flagellar hook-associated protein 2
MKVDKVLQEKQLIQWQQDLYREIIGDINTFKSTYFDVLKADSYMLSGNTYSSFEVSSNAARFATASASASAVAGTYTLSNVVTATKASQNGGNNISIAPTSSSKMSSLFRGKVNFNINGKDFSYDFDGVDKNKTIQNILDDISTKAGVKASYSELSGRFSITSINTGFSEQLNISWNNEETDSSNFLNTLFSINTENSTLDPNDDDGTKYSFRTAGTDASVTIKDPNGNVNTVIKSTNTFTIDGVTYSLLQNTEETKEIQLTVSANVNKTFNKIVEFVDKYNSLIDKINSKITEKKQYSYKPLTDDQKKDMSENEIKLWEEKAKQGLLKGDTYLEGLLSKMRSAFFDPVKNTYSDNLYDSDNIGIQLTDIGLSTSSDISQRGKIIIDEAKLREALLNNGDKVAELFTKRSTSQPSYRADMSSTDRNQRYQELGIFQRINDILQDYVRTTRDSNGKKGMLLEKAGIKGDFSDLNNMLSEQLTAKERLIEDLNKRLREKEEKFYAQFAKLEKAMNQLNSQSMWLAQQLGGYGG